MNVKMFSQYICLMCEFSLISACLKNMTPLFLYLHYFCKNKTHTKTLKDFLQNKNKVLQNFVLFCYTSVLRTTSMTNYGATCTSVRPALVLLIGLKHYSHRKESV